MSTLISYPSPAYRFDPIAEIMITERLNASTGTVTSQDPSAAVMRDADIAALTGDRGAGFVSSVWSVSFVRTDVTSASTSVTSASSADSKPNPYGKGPVVADNVMAGPQENDLQIISPNKVSFLA